MSDLRVSPGDGRAHTGEIQQAVDACAARGGGRVVLEPGLHRSGTVILRDGVTLHLEKDAVLSASPDLDDYHGKELSAQLSPRERAALGGRTKQATALVFAEDAARIALTGEGTLDGNGALFWKEAGPRDWVEEQKAMGTWVPAFDYVALARPMALVLLVGCRDVRIEDVRLRNSPRWTVHLLACEEVAVRRVVLRGVLHGSNTDGIDLDGCSDVRVEDCDIVTGDDALALKNTDAWGRKRPSRRIAVRRCRLGSTTHGFTIGTETQADFEEIAVEDCRIEAAGGHRTKTAIGLSVLDGAAIRGVRLSRVTVDGAVAPIQIRLGNEGRGQAAKAPGRIEGLLFEDVAICDAVGNSFIAGLPGHPVRDVAFRGLRLEFDGPEPPEILSQVPSMEAEYPPPPVWCRLPAYAFYCRDVSGLEFSDAVLAATAPTARPALSLDRVEAFAGRALTAA